jgi:hypothetical protein
MIAVVVLTGCATSGSPGVASPATSAVVTSASTSASTAASAGPPADDWAALQAAVAEADAQLVTARSQGWWSGPVCSPDIELHRENAGQDPLPDEELRAECAANIAEFWASKEDYDRLQALDDSARAAELARVGTVLGLPAGQEPTVTQVVVVHGCEQGWITDPADCAGIPAG